jgi:hypothetical protein
MGTSDNYQHDASFFVSARITLHRGARATHKEPYCVEVHVIDEGSMEWRPISPPDPEKLSPHEQAWLRASKINIAEGAEAARSLAHQLLQTIVDDSRSEAASVEAQGIQEELRTAELPLWN